MDNFSIDIETLGTEPNSVILSIGVVAFDPHTNTIDEEGLEVNLDVEEQISLGMTINYNTVVWWMGKSDEARKVFRSENMVGLSDCYNHIKRYLEKHQPDTGNVKPWGNGSSFDIVLLESLFRLMSKEPLWKYHNIRDVRTIVDLAGLDPKPYRLKGIHHNALDDAINQANMVCDCYTKLGLT